MEMELTKPTEELLERLFLASQETWVQDSDENCEELTVYYRVLMLVYILGLISGVLMMVSVCFVVNYTFGGRYAESPVNCVEAGTQVDAPNHSQFSPSNPGGSFLPQRVMSARASPPHSRVPAAHRAGPKLLAEMSREDDQHWGMGQHQCPASSPSSPVERLSRQATSTPRRRGSTVGGSGDARPAQMRRAARKRSHQAHAPCAQTRQSGSGSAQRMMANNMFSNDSRLVLPKGSVPQLCDTKRSVAVQTVDSVEDSLWDWLTTSTPEALQQWCSVQHKYWVELQRLQRRIHGTLDRVRGPSRQPPSRTQTAVLEHLRGRIWAVALDMSALNQSCNVDSNTPRAPQGPSRPAVCRRTPTSIPQTRLRDERGDHLRRTG